MSKEQLTVSKTQQPPSPENETAAKVPLNTLFAGDMFRRLSKYKQDKGLPYEQDVIRLAVAFFLDKSGY